MNELAIKVNSISKIYKLYEKPIDRLKESLSITKKVYHKKHFALNDVSFEVMKGETVGIIGVNGSGKSTLLKIITGVLTPSSGDVTVDGKVSALLELGAGFNSEYTGIENIYLNGTLMGYTKAEMDIKVESILEFADIGEFINQPLKTYSSGMFARLAFSVAINVDPNILIVDEALSVGDIFFQNKCFRKFEELKNSGTTILFVSHDIGSIKQMCSRVLWLDNGSKIIYGEKNEVCTQYLNEKFRRLNKLNEETKKSAEIENNNLLYYNKPTDSIKVPKVKINKNDKLSEEASIISFFIKNKSGNITTDINADETYYFHLIAKFNKEIDSAIFGFTLENNKGIDVLAVNTFVANNEKVIKCKKNTVVEAIFEIDIPKLRRGQYLISPAIADGTQINHRTITWLHNNLTINVDNGGYNLSMIELDLVSTINCYDMNNVVLY